MAEAKRAFTEKYREGRSVRESKGKYTGIWNSCCICGKKTNPTSKSVRFVMISARNEIVSPKEGMEEWGHLGLFPIGSECRRGLPRGWALTREKAGL